MQASPLSQLGSVPSIKVLLVAVGRAFLVNQTAHAKAQRQEAAAVHSQAWCLSEGWDPAVYSPTHIKPTLQRSGQAL